jgi:DNA (cytosine-5)-methyltransferase 1
MSFTFVDLFAGIGGFHAVLSQAGGTCVMASEIDPRAAEVYRLNWASGLRPRRGRPLVEGDIVPLTDPVVPRHVPKHDVLAAGFPCQPFSKSGYQRGVDEARGTLFFNILKIIEARRPQVVFLENVRNLAGPRHRDTFATIVRLLREQGYLVSSEPTVFSPHLLPPHLGGTPQVRDRVYILGTYVGRRRALAETDLPRVVDYEPVGDWSPSRWRIDDYLDEDESILDVERYRLSAEERRWIRTWDEFVRDVTDSRGDKLPGFPLWADYFRKVSVRELLDFPEWKVDFVRKNERLYLENRRAIDRWLGRHDHLLDFPASRRKLEWQAQRIQSLNDTVMHFRPSGIRAKAPTYVPAMVAMNQTTVVGSRGRRITPTEGARLQGLPDGFTFGTQADSHSYRQLGNSIAVGAAAHVLQEFLKSSTMTGIGGSDIMVGRSRAR